MSTTTSAHASHEPFADAAAHTGASDALLAEAARHGADAEVWTAWHETDELVCRDGAVERRSEVLSGATALTVWADGNEGYAVRNAPGATDTALVTTALAIGRVLAAGDTAPAPRTDRAPRTEPPAPLPRIGADATARLRALTEGADDGDVEIELRARADRTRVRLHRAGTDPAEYDTGVAQLFARITARGSGTGYIGHQIFGRTMDGVLDAAERTELGELVGLARILTTRPATALDHDDVLVDGRVLCRLLTLVAPAFLLDSVLEGRSPLKDGIGERVASPGVTLVDDPTADDAPLPAPWDGEGTPTGPTVLVEDGVLRGFLSSRRTAAEAGAPATGSAQRGANGEMTTVQPGHLVLSHTEDLGTETRPGRTVLHIVQANGAHTSNPITGDFSIGANAVLVSPDGTRRNAGNITLAGNVFDLLRSIDGHDGRVRVNRSNNSFVAGPGVWTRSLTVGHQEGA
ncbi:TldD/PmbA family protein [Streptomyces sp. M54]|uniref:TldD/PmbA family protein n=1 Tax=Streptomyces sp. M54 TaxID=2759525 RepID=UPI001A8E9E73|nr:metallopeptidase TldD-related protein [Streptomyces sp. M54]QSS94817.1 TldD/PmbA family protein [Streptomyces sp. M54]